MRAIIQRVDGASVTVDGREVGRIDGPGLAVLVGVTHDDTQACAHRLAAKIHDMRLFDRDGTALSAADLGLPILVISQFTLYADTRKGRRPTWDAAAPGPIAQPLVAAVVEELRSRGAVVATGEFGAHMRVALVNDGPVTIIVDVHPD